uniref:CSON001858 protein n=1 Tax=Culicoides sonorensis TaxID=179676 RepID=A0A336K1E9_CULSO
MCGKYSITLSAMILFINSLKFVVSTDIPVDPTFNAPIANVTVAIGREAILTCVVTDLGSYKVAWLRVDTQTILTIQNHVITKNHRVGVTYTENKTWQVRIKDIRESDKGWYMCQINTDPMKSQMGYLDVVVPPDILDYPTSTDMVVREGTNVTLRCVATGSPTPNILWRRENGETIALPNGVEVASVEGSTFTIPRVNRGHMGPYFCIASNGVPPTVSKRVMLIVHFPPMISVPNQLVGAVEGQRITLECFSEAYPKSINYWTRDKGDIVPIVSQGGKFEPQLIDDKNKVIMKLTINYVSIADFGSYKCIAKNSLGDTDGTIKLYKIPHTTLNSLDAFSDLHKKGKSKKEGNYFDSRNDIVDDDPVNTNKDLMIDGSDGNAYVNSGSNVVWKCSSVIIFLFLTTVVDL